MDHETTAIQFRHHFLLLLPLLNFKGQVAATRGLASSLLILSAIRLCSSSNATDASVGATLPPALVTGTMNRRVNRQQKPLRMELHSSSPLEGLFASFLFSASERCAFSRLAIDERRTASTDAPAVTFKSHSRGSLRT